MTQKLANKKYLEHETKKLTLKEKNLEQHWDNEMKTFYNKYEESIKKCKEFDKKSPVLEIIDVEKIKQLEEMLNKIYEETNLSDIDSLIKFFAHCLKEVLKIYI